MNKKIKLKVCLYLLLISVLIPLVANARYFEKLQNFKGKATIAEPIFKVVNLTDKIITDINKESVVKEYLFNIKNYIDDDVNKTFRVSQVDLSYNIEIVNENSNFPMSCTLYENDTNTILKNGIGKTEDILINKNVKYEKDYKLIVRWERKDGILANTDNIRIIVNSSQEK